MINIVRCIAKLTITFFLILIMNLTALADSGMKAAYSNHMQENKNKVMAMYRYFESLRTKPLKLSDLSLYYTPNVKMIINGETVASGIKGFYDHFNFMLSKTRNFQFVFSKNPMIAEGDRIAIKYRILMREKLKMKTMYVIAYLTLSHGKIGVWNEVVSSSSPNKLKLKEIK
ncbi:MAG: nuclear transport factor 2 family protein [Coxiellaceae bacterium]|nr:nuclear transport factor 2 family protein [Coxiellaceae bacterium]